MHIRRLVKSGAASHTISLPKEWIKRNSLEKGDLLDITDQGDKLIVKLNSEKQDAAKIKEITLSIDDKEINILRRETIAAYINNYKQFIFSGNSLNKRLEEIRGILNNFLALEIVEQSDTKLIAKDFLNLQEFSLHNTLRRMDMLARSMLTDCKQGKSESKSLQFKDFEVDKLFFLISRLIRSHLQNPFTDMNNIEAMSTWWLAKNFESIADSAKNLSKDFSKESLPVFKKIEEYYAECAKAYFKKDKQLANKLIDKRIDLLEECDKLKSTEKEKLKSLINNSRNIAKIIMDSEN